MRAHIIRRGIFATLSYLSLAAPSLLATAFSFTPIELDNQTPILGTTIAYVDSWTLGDGGEVLAGVRLTPNPAAGVTADNQYALLWRAPGGDWSQVLRQGDLVPGGNGDRFINAEAGNFGPNGSVLFGASDTSGHSIFRATLPGAPEPLISEGQSAPDTNNWSFLLLGPPYLMNRQGTILSRAYAIDSAGTTGGWGQWMSKSGQAPHAVVVARNNAPGINGIFDRGTDFDARINDMNEVAFSAIADPVPLDDGTLRTGIWRYSMDGNLSLVSTGDSFATSGAPAINNQGTIYFRSAAAFDTHSNSGLFASDRAGNISVLATAQTPVPNFPGQYLHDFTASGRNFPVIANSRGDVAFQNTVGGLNAPFPSNTGVFLVTPDHTLKTVALTGQIAPGTNRSFSLLDNATIALNDRGELLILSSTRTGPTTNPGLWLYDINSDMLSLILRENQPFEVAPGDIRTIQYIETASFHGSADGRGKLLGNDGHLLVNLWFTDGTRGLFLTQVPEPAAIPTLLLPLLLSARRRPKRTPHRAGKGP